MALKTKLPNIESGYELGANIDGYFSVIVPEERTINYIKNPVFYTHDSEHSYRARGTATTPCYYGYSFYNATAIPKDRDFSIYRAGAKVIPTNPILDSATIFYIANDIPAGTYTFSAYCSGGVDHQFELKVTNATRTLQFGEAKIEYGGGLNGFQRMHVTFTLPTDMTITLRLTQYPDSQGRLEPFYTDMWMLENKPYMTHHFIGHPMDFMHDNKGGEFKWWGVPHFSYSERTEKSYGSGKIVNLYDAGFRLTGIAGLGVNPMNMVVNDVASGGGVFDGVTDAIRTFTLIGRIYGRDMQEVLTRRKDLYELLRPKGRNENDQPTTLMFRIKDCETDKWIGQPLFIYCRYTSGLEGAFDSETGEEITITFTSEDPYIYSLYIKNYDITPTNTYYQYPEDTGKISPIFLWLDADGVWTRLNMRLSGPTPGAKHNDLCIVEDILPDGTGGYYVYGNFTTVFHNGTSYTVNGIFRYNKETDSIAQMGQNPAKGLSSGGNIKRVIVAPSGEAIVVGAFPSVGNVENTNCIAMYKPSSNSWHSVSAGITGLGSYEPYINDVEYGDDNNIYVSGRFGSIGDLPSLPVEGIARMSLDTLEWDFVPIARDTFVYYEHGMSIIRLFRQTSDTGYDIRPVSGFISGSHMSQPGFSPFTMSNVYWDGEETFFTNHRANGNYANGPYPANTLLYAFRGVIDQTSRSYYFIDGTNSLYKMNFVMPPHTKEGWYYLPGMPYPKFTTTYLYPNRNAPTKWGRMNPPFARTVRVDFGASGVQNVSLAELRYSQLKITHSRLLLSPNFSYGLDAYETDIKMTVPVSKTVPLIWVNEIWTNSTGNSYKFKPYPVFARNNAYTAAFHIRFDIGTAFIAVNPGHVRPNAKPGDNHINAIASGYKAVYNKGERTPVHFKVSGPASIKRFYNKTTNKLLAFDGYMVPRYSTVNIATIGTPHSSFGREMHQHMLDTSDANMQIVPGKNIVNCDMDNIGTNTEILLVFRERYASISKATEYIGG